MPLQIGPDGPDSGRTALQAHYGALVEPGRQGPHPAAVVRVGPDKVGRRVPVKDATAHFGKALELAPDNVKISESDILKKHLGG